ncbi:MAG TPA: PIN domain-containing protein [Solirubrobacterales bacterium]|nr:PIN domain-containing protein [Solirubrobacterales bacterium]
MLLLDASVWIASKDSSDRYCSTARPLVLDADLPVSALDLTVYEVANVVGTRWRQLDAARELTRTIASRCGDQLVRVDSGLFESALDIASEHGLTAYDAAYVAAARRGGMTLVSADIADLVSKGLAVAPDDADYP